MIVKALCLQVSTGLKDDDLETQYNLFQEHIIQKPKPYYCYDQSLEPDVWFDAAKVNKTLLLEKKRITYFKSFSMTYLRILPLFQVFKGDTKDIDSFST